MLFETFITFFFCVVFICKSNNLMIRTDINKKYVTARRHEKLFLIYNIFPDIAVKNITRLHCVRTSFFFISAFTWLFLCVAWSLHFVLRSTIQHTYTDHTKPLSLWQPPANNHRRFLLQGNKLTVLYFNDSNILRPIDTQLSSSKRIAYKALDALFSSKTVLPLLGWLFSSAKGAADTTLIPY